MPDLPVFVGVFLLCFIAACGMLTAVAVALLLRWVFDEAPGWSYRLRHRRKKH